MIKEESICLFCGKKFSKNRWWQKYCNQKCRKDYFNKKHGVDFAKKIPEIEREINKIKEQLNLKGG